MKGRSQLADSTRQIEMLNFAKRKYNFWIKKYYVALVDQKEESKEDSIQLSYGKHYFKAFFLLF